MKPIWILILTTVVVSICYSWEGVNQDPIYEIASAYKITNNLDMAITIAQECKFYNVPIELALAVAYVESRFNPTCLSRNKNSVDIGVFQLNSKSYHKYSTKELLDLDTNIKFGVSHIEGLYKRHKGDIVKTLWCYNAGSGAFNRGKLPTTTKKYIGLVTAKYKEYKDMWR